MITTTRNVITLYETDNGNYEFILSVLEDHNGELSDLSLQINFNNSEVLFIDNENYIYYDLYDSLIYDEENAEYKNLILFFDDESLRSKLLDMYEEAVFKGFFEHLNNNKNEKINDSMEIDRYYYKGVLIQRLTKDYLWYAIYNNQIVKWDQYRNDLENWIELNIFKK